ncbi:MAG: C39 family peptidase, partial [Chloroflexi bacterium]|nr:C39 family peptidase [Chloroflexota bacterium]
PVWLNSFIDKFFPPPKIISPIVETPFPETSEATTPLGELNKKSASQATESAKPAETVTPPVETPAAPESPASKYDTYYDIPAKSQGTEYGSAACLPTSMSMVLDHFHNGDADLKTATPGELVKMLDNGDGTSGSGVGLDKLNDDLAELGYQSNVTTGSMEDLSTQLKDGPVIVNTGVKLLSVPARDIASTPGATNQ